MFELDPTEIILDLLCETAADVAKFPEQYVVLDDIGDLTAFITRNPMFEHEPDFEQRAAGILGNLNGRDVVVRLNLTEEDDYDDDMDFSPCDDPDCLCNDADCGQDDEMDDDGNCPDCGFQASRTDHFVDASPKAVTNTQQDPSIGSTSPLDQRMTFFTDQLTAAVLKKLKNETAVLNSCDAPDPAPAAPPTQPVPLFSVHAEPFLVHGSTLRILNQLRHNQGQIVTSLRASGKTTALMLRAIELNNTGRTVNVVVANTLGLYKNLLERLSEFRRTSDGIVISLTAQWGFDTYLADEISVLKPETFRTLKSIAGHKLYGAVASL